MFSWSCVASRSTCAALLACGLIAGARCEEQITRDLDRSANLVVSLETRIGDRTVLGAGVIVARERDAVLVVTANHVVRQGSTSAQEIVARFKGAPQKQAPGILLSDFDKKDDVAVIRVERMRERAVDPCGLPPPRFEDQLVIRRGHGVFPIGNPSGIAWRIPVAPDEVTDVNDREITFQSALIESGHSGGGLFNAFGDLVGIIKADQPPYGLAIRLDRVIVLLRGWAYPIDSESRATRSAASGTQSSVVTAKTRPPADACVEQRAVRQDAGRSNQDHIASLPTSAEKWGWSGSEPWLPLFLAVQRGHLGEVRRMVDAKALDPDGYHPPFPLHWAAAFGQVEVVKQLLLMGAKKNAYVYTPFPGDNYRRGMGTPLHVATRANRLEVIQVLISAGAALEEGVGLEGSGSPLALAARYDLRDAAKLLIASGADVDAGSRLHGGREMTPLGQSVAYGHTEMIKLLEAAKAHLASADSDGGPPALLRVAVEFDQLEAMRYLIGRAVPMECGDAHGICNTPLFDALTDGKLDAAQLLLDSGANPDGTAWEPYLQVAIEWKNMRAVKLLLKAGANPNGKNRDGKSMLAFALEKDNGTAAALLRAYGAKH